MITGTIIWNSMTVFYARFCAIAIVCVFAQNCDNPVITFFSGTLNFTEFVNMLTDYGKITSSSPALKEKVNQNCTNVLLQ